MLYSANQISAKLLLDFAQKAWIDNNPAADLSDHQRYLMMHDLYIKARSYSLINKVAFWFALLLGIAVVVWPSFAVISEDFGWKKEFLKSAIVQTTVTAFAGLAFTIYAHYKKRQVYIENLMRSIVYAPSWDDSILERVLKEMERIDSGFGFAQALAKSRAEKDADEAVHEPAKTKRAAATKRVSAPINEKKSTDTKEG